MTAQTDRRAMLVGVAACVAAGAVGSVAGSHTARAATGRAETTVEDRRILELCGQFDALEHERVALCDGPAAIVDDDECDQAVAPIEAQIRAVVDRIARYRASSPEALAAVARCLILWEAEVFTDPRDPDAHVDRRLARWLAENAAAMARRAA